MDTPPAKSFVVELNEKARSCSNPDWRKALQLSATRLHNALEELRKLPTQPAMQAVMGAWARAENILKRVPPEAGPAAPTVAAMGNVEDSSGNFHIARLAA